MTHRHIKLDFLYLLNYTLSLWSSGSAPYRSFSYDLQVVI